MNINSTKYNKIFISLIIITCAIPGFIYGLHVSVFSARATFGIDIIKIDDLAKLGDTISKIMFYFTILGSLVTGFVADRFGRKKMLVLSAIFLIIGLFFKSVSINIPIFLIGKILVSLGIGIFSVAVPLYLAETVPGRFRGAGIAIFQLVLSFGIFSANSTGISSGTGNPFYVVILLLIPSIFF